MTEKAMKTIDQAGELPGKRTEDQDASAEIVNDSLGTVDLADTADTDPEDDSASQQGQADAEAAKH
jgi:hypothetical protein